MQAYGHANSLVEFAGKQLGSSSHPNVMPVWQYVEELHHRGGDAAGAVAAHKKVLQCRSAAQRSRDESHKPKQLKQAKRR